jgi:acyl-CoA thioester hydrolase
MLEFHDTSVRVRYVETDQMGVVYHANYLIWCEIGRTDHIRAIGTPYRDIEKQGITLAVSEASMRFHASARYDDLIRVETVLAKVTSRTLVFDYVVKNAETDERLATVSTTLISLDPGGRVTAMPADLRAKMASVASDAA